MKSSSNRLRTGILTGPTATGKTALALKLAQDMRSLGVTLEIINADSTLVYRDAQIGCAKPTREELEITPHHLIDRLPLDASFTAGDFVQEAKRLIGEIHARGNRALIVGGTGFYLKALLFGLWDAPKADPEIRKRLESIDSPTLYQRLLSLDEKAALRLGVNDRYRLLRALEMFEATGKTPSQLEEASSKEPDPQFVYCVLDREPKELLERVRRRVDEMLAQGFLEEVKRIREKCPNAKILQSVGYAQAVNYLDQILPAGRKTRPGLEGLRDEIILAHQQLIKKQRTWFKSQKFAIRDEIERVLKEIYGPDRSR